VTLEPLERWRAGLRLLALPALAAGTQLALAAPGIEECRAPAPECAPVGKWNLSLALGAGEITNPLVNGENIPLVVIPHVSYYGTRFFLDDLDAGVTLYDDDFQTLSLIATPGYDRVYFYRTDPQNFFLTGFTSNGAATYTTDVNAATALNRAGVPTQRLQPRARRFTYLAGPEWTFKYSNLTGQIDVLREITDQNNGDEVRAALSAPLLRIKGVLSANIGLTWKSSAIVNYYYGQPGLYEAGSSFDPFVKLAYTLPLSSKWRFNAFYQYEHLGNAIANSPIVAEHSVATMFVGAVYTF
jgi:MipA family protein